MNFIYFCKFFMYINLLLVLMKSKNYKYFIQNYVKFWKLKDIQKYEKGENFKQCTKNWSNWSILLRFNVNYEFNFWNSTYYFLFIEFVLVRDIPCGWSSVITYCNIPMFKVWNWWSYPILALGLSWHENYHVTIG